MENHIWVYLHDVASFYLFSFYAFSHDDLSYVVCVHGDVHNDPDKNHNNSAANKPAT